MENDQGTHGLITAAQDALAKAAKAAGVAGVAAGIGLAALIVGMIAVVLAVAAIVARVTGEMLSRLAVLITGIIEAVVAMVPELLHMAIMAGAMAAMWVSFQWTWIAYSQDMPPWLAAMLAGALVVVPVGWALYRQLWPAVVVVSLGIVGAGWLLWNAGPVLRTGAIVGGLGAVVIRDVMSKHTSHTQGD